MSYFPLLTFLFGLFLGYFFNSNRLTHKHSESRKGLAKTSTDARKRH